MYWFSRRCVTGAAIVPDTTLTRRWTMASRGACWIGPLVAVASPRLRLDRTARPLCAERSGCGGLGVANPQAGSCLSGSVRRGGLGAAGFTGLFPPRAQTTAGGSDGRVQFPPAAICPPRAAPPPGPRVPESVSSTTSTRGAYAEGGSAVGGQAPRRGGLGGRTLCRCAVGLSSPGPPTIRGARAFFWRGRPPCIAGSLMSGALGGAVSIKSGRVPVEARRLFMVLALYRLAVRAIGVGVVRYPSGCRSTRASWRWRAAFPCAERLELRGFPITAG